MFSLSQERLAHRIPREHLKKLCEYVAMTDCFDCFPSDFRVTHFPSCRPPHGTETPGCLSS